MLRKRAFKTKKEILEIRSVLAKMENSIHDSKMKFMEIS